MSERPSSNTTHYVHLWHKNEVFNYPDDFSTQYLKKDINRLYALVFLSSADKLRSDDVIRSREYNISGNTNKATLNRILYVRVEWSKK